MNWKKRAVGVRFNRELRAGITKNEKENATPGPGDYMIPCKFLVRPRFMEHKENKFRFVWVKIKWFQKNDKFTLIKYETLIKKIENIDF